LVYIFIILSFTLNFYFLYNLLIFKFIKFFFFFNLKKKKKKTYKTYNNKNLLLKKTIFNNKLKKKNLNLENNFIRTFNTINKKSSSISLISSISIALKNKLYYCFTFDTTYNRKILDIMIKFGVISHYLRISHIKNSVNYNFYNKNYLKIDLIQNNLKDRHLQILQIYLSYDSNGCAIMEDIKNLSTPGNRKYISISSLKKDFKLSRSDLVILSTTKGILTADEAIFYNVGGELICRCKIH
jgi:ribosomal protein S8